MSSVTGTRTFAFALLALASLFWAGNWVLGRALRTAFDPIALNFWRWLVAVLVLAPFALPGLIGQRRAIRRHAGLLALLALSGVVVFHSLIYLGLRTTTVVNAVLLNSSAPLFMLMCSWAIEREGATLRQISGMLLSFIGILVIVLRGEVGNLPQFDFQFGDAWILVAMPFWGIYSVLLKRRPPEFGEVSLLFAVSVTGLVLLLPAFALEALRSPPGWPSIGEVGGVLYVGLAASVGAYICWNRGVAVVGANAAGFTLHLLPAFGTALAIVFLGETFHPFHAAGFAAILFGVVVATRSSKK